MADESRTGSVTIALADRSGRLTGVRLVDEIGLAGSLEFTRSRGTWSLTIDAPTVNRMEYLLEIRDNHGDRITITDPTNPLRAPGAFGDKSVLEFDGYAPPRWIAEPVVDSDETAMQVQAPELDAAIEVVIWAPGGLASSEPAPLMIVHDGPEFARIGAFTHYLGASVASGALPPLRAALVAPGDRNSWYAANPDYAHALHEHVLPALDDAFASSVRIGVGVSLGGLAMLHAQWMHPDLVDGLFLQSGSFFTPELDPQERDFSGFGRVTDFVAAVHAAAGAERPVPTVLICGCAEENLANNQAMAAALARLGYPLEMRTVADAHNFTAWRDALDPYLSELVGEVTRAP